MFPTKFGHDFWGPTEVAEKAREPAETQENLQQQAAMAAVNAAINAARTGGSTSWAEIRPFSWRIDGENDQKNMDFWGCLMILDAFCPNLWPLLASYSWGELPKTDGFEYFRIDPVVKPSCQTCRTTLPNFSSTPDEVEALNFLRDVHMIHMGMASMAQDFYPLVVPGK